MAATICICTPASAVTSRSGESIHEMVHRTSLPPTRIKIEFPHLPPNLRVPPEEQDLGKAGRGMTSMPGPEFDQSPDAVCGASLLAGPPTPAGGVVTAGGDSASVVRVSITRAR